MRFLKIGISLFIAIFISCNQKQEIEVSPSTQEIIIPLIEKDKNHTAFKLKNGVLFFHENPYSGVVNEFYNDDGKLKSKSEYYLGKRQGVFNGWYSNGNKWFERFYTNGLKIVKA